MHQFDWYVSFKGEKLKNLRAFGAVLLFIVETANFAPIQGWKKLKSWCLQCSIILHSWNGQFRSNSRMKTLKSWRLRRRILFIVEISNFCLLKDEKPKNLCAFGAVFSFMIEMTNNVCFKDKKNYDIFAPSARYYCSWLKFYSLLKKLLLVPLIFWNLFLICGK